MSHPTQNPANEDPRVKLVEFVATLGGLLGIVDSLLSDLLPTQSKTGLALMFVLFIVFSFLAYAALAMRSPPRKVRLALAGQSATFSGLIVLALSIPLSNATVGIAIQSTGYIGVVGAVVVYVVAFLALTYLLYWTITRGMMQIFEQITPH